MFGVPGPLRAKLGNFELGGWGGHAKNGPKTIRKSHFSPGGTLSTAWGMVIGLMFLGKL